MTSQFSFFLALPVRTDLLKNTRRVAQRRAPHHLILSTPSDGIASGEVSAVTGHWRHLDLTRLDRVLTPDNEWRKHVSRVTQFEIKCVQAISVHSGRQCVSSVMTWNQHNDWWVRWRHAAHGNPL